MLTTAPPVGSLVPHFAVTTNDGARVRYADVWQREQLLFVQLPDESAGAWPDFEQQLEANRERCRELEAALVITRDRVFGDVPLAVVADRWGEITHAAELRIDEEQVQPEVLTLLLWVDAMLLRCPECEGEAR